MARSNSILQRGEVIIVGEYGGSVVCAGQDVPADAGTNYLPGCLFIHSDGVAGDNLYVNDGSRDSCDFNQVLTAGRAVFSAGATISLGEGTDLVLGTSTGTKVGTAITQKLGFFNATPIVQRAGAAQAAVVTTGATNSSPYGFATAAQADAIVTLVNELRAALVAFGLIKGAA